ncbi:MAG: Ethyl tert-butyl ether degradation EthD [Frankiales bacterium]|nr:Ethyl tert-butyl ether degradation EthD [Frankiales bacterium]
MTTIPRTETATVKLFALLPKRPDIPLATFHEHWRTIHKDHALNMRNLRRYVQNHRVEAVPEGFPPAPFEGFDAAPYPGIAEAWFDDLATAAGMGEDPDYVGGAKLDEPNFMDMDRLAFLITRERVLIEGPPLAQDAELTKVLLLLRRRPSTTPEEFRASWDAHAELAVQVPGLVRYVQSAVLPETYTVESPPPFDGVAELWWATPADLASALLSPDITRVLADLSTFAGPGSSAVLVHELRPIWG